MVIALVVAAVLAVIATAVGLMLYNDKRELTRVKKLDRVDRSSNGSRA
jgi:Tfp pilus assembly protein FimT